MLILHRACENAMIAVASFGTINQCISDSVTEVFSKILWFMQYCWGTSEFWLLIYSHVSFKWV